MLKLTCAMALITTSAACATDSLVPQDLPPFTSGVSTLTGHNDPGDVDGERNIARLWNPVSVAYGPDGRVYVADFDNGKIRVANADTGSTVTHVEQKHFYRPFAIAFGPDGALYATTDKNSTDSMQTAMTGSLWKIQGGVAKLVAENLGRPRGLCIAKDGTIILSDYQHHVIERVDPATGGVTTLAGRWNADGMADGAAARFNVPYGMAWSGDQLVVADFENHRVRLVDMDGTVQTLAGTGTAGYEDGPVATAKFNHPQGVAVAANGDVFITDLGNNRIRRIRAGVVDTVAGNGNAGWHDDDDLLAAEFFGLEGITVRPDGAFVYVADGTRGDDAQPYNYVRMIKLQ